MDVIHNGPETFRGPAQQFTGDVRVDVVALVDQEPQGLQVLKVHFAPGARTAWHSHPAGQTLVVLDGVGRAQERGGPVQEIRNGDAVVTGPDVWHWHGASPDRFMTHLAIQQTGLHGASAAWGDPVDEPDYVADVTEP
jgi:quercetin dioxygenase-like cupin family protein